MIDLTCAFVPQLMLFTARSVAKPMSPPGCTLLGFSIIPLGYKLTGFLKAATEAFSPACSGLYEGQLPQCSIVQQSRFERIK